MTSKSWADAKQNGSLQSVGHKMTMALMRSEAVPNKQRLGVHMRSSLHQTALQVFFSSGVGPLTLKKPLSLIDDGRGVPTPKEFIIAWDFIVKGVSGRSHSSHDGLQRWFETTEEVKPVNRETLHKLAHVMAEGGLRSEWRQQIKQSVSLAISFDGHQAYDEIHFHAVRSDFKIVQGMVGISEPFRGSKEKLSKVWHRASRHFRI